ncbi:MAG: hypothetical protein GY861_06440 [bacterium]|nr:hypothetical protein [bacterium]
MKPILICILALFMILSVSAVEGGGYMEELGDAFFGPFKEMMGAKESEKEQDSEEVQEPAEEDGSDKENSTYLEDVGKGLESPEIEPTNYTEVSDEFMGMITKEAKSRKRLFQLVMAVTLITFSAYLFNRVLKQIKV